MKTVNVATVLTALDGTPIKETRYGPPQMTKDGPVQLMLPADQRADLTLRLACITALEQPIDPKSIISQKELRELHKIRQGLAIKLFTAIGDKSDVELEHDEIELLMTLMPLAFHLPTVCGQAMRLLGG